MGKLPNYMQYFGSNIVEGVAESWVEAEMSWVEFEMHWVEVDGAGWRWVHSLVIPDLESGSLRYYVYQFSDETDNFGFLGSNLPKNGFWGQNFKSLSLDSELASLRYYVY